MVPTPTIPRTEKRHRMQVSRWSKNTRELQEQRSSVPVSDNGCVDLWTGLKGENVAPENHTRGDESGETNRGLLKGRK